MTRRAKPGAGGVLLAGLLLSFAASPGRAQEATDTEIASLIGCYEVTVGAWDPAAPPAAREESPALVRLLADVRASPAPAFPHRHHVRSFPRTYRRAQVRGSAGAPIPGWRWTAAAPERMRLEGERFALSVRVAGEGRLEGLIWLAGSTMKDVRAGTLVSAPVELLRSECDRTHGRVH